MVMGFQFEQIGTLSTNLSTKQDKLSGVTVTMTAASTSVSIESQDCKQYGNILFFSVKFSTSAQINAYGNVLGYPSGARAATGIIVPLCSAGFELRSSEPTTLYSDSGNQYLRAPHALPIGSNYRVTGCVLI